MKFWDREKEMADLKRYLQNEPNAILFVYGPKSSGKSALLERVAQKLDERFKMYWYDLRGKVIESYRDVLGVFFREIGWKEKMLSAIARLARINLNVFELNGEELKKVLEREYDAFEVMERELAKDVEEGEKPVIVFDEIQNLKDVYMNGGRSLVSRLFNFFVRLTKVRHLAHVLVMTSDTFFIEEVYSSSALKNTSRYYLVDYFDDETAFRILVKEGLSEEEARYAVNWIGGVPWMMEEILDGEDVKVVIRELYDQTFGKVYEAVRGREDLKELLRRALNGENLYYEEEKMESVKELVEKEVLFFDPINRFVKFQTKLDERAARELIRA